MPNQISRITGTQDSRGFNSIKEQQEQEDIDQYTPKNEEEQQKEDLLLKIQEYQLKFGNLDLKLEENKNKSTQNNQNLKILHKDVEEQLNLKTDLESYMNKNESIERQDPDGYIKSNLEKNEKLREEIKQQKRIRNENLVEKDLINKLSNSNKIEKSQATPEKRIGQNNQINKSNDQDSMPGLPSHITGSMRKIRNSPAMAENEQIYQ